jgi:hypothetical protein
VHLLRDLFTCASAKGFIRPVEIRKPAPVSGIGRMKTRLKYLTLEELLGRLTIYQEKLTLAVTEKETTVTLTAA